MTPTLKTALESAAKARSECEGGAPWEERDERWKGGCRDEARHIIAAFARELLKLEAVEPVALEIKRVIEDIDRGFVSTPEEEMREYQAAAQAAIAHDPVRVALWTVAGEE